MHGVEFHYLDIDECADETSGCEQLCNNNNGSYSCACQDNYTLALDIRSCLGNHCCMFRNELYTGGQIHRATTKCVLEC